ncbi:MAG: class I SAM-dependent methyltransferase [Hyphomicrobium sp.]|nr:class I SAM-dependent methyltransferase [Hyphomicrobium sp.]
MSDSLTHAEQMDRQYRFQRYVYDITRRYYLLGRLHLVRELKPPVGGSLIEIGCGTGWNMARVLDAYPGVSVAGVDISNAMLETARTSLGRKGHLSRVKLAQGDATNFDPEALFGRRTFDRVYISYAVSMIPVWREAVRHAATMVAPGGTLSVVDFGQCESLPQVFKAGLFRWLAHYHVTPRPDLEAVLKAVAAENGYALTFERLSRGYAYFGQLSRPA